MSKPEWAQDLPPARTTAKGRTPRKIDGRGRTPGSATTQFKKGNPGGPGRQARADVWAVLERAAEIATERAREEGKEVTVDLTADELVAQLIETVKRWEPEKALRIMAPLIYPKAQYKPIDIVVNLETDAGIASTLEAIAVRMANGGDVASLSQLFNVVSAVQQSRALALEMDLSRKELADGV